MCNFSLFVHFIIIIAVDIIYLILGISESIQLHTDLSIFWMIA